MTKESHTNLLPSQQQFHYDKGYSAGWENAINRMLYICITKRDRLEPGKRKRTRESLEELIYELLTLKTVITKTNED